MKWVKWADWVGFCTRVSSPQLALFGLQSPPTALLLSGDILAGQPLPDTIMASTSSSLLSRSCQAGLGFRNLGFSIKARRTSATFSAITVHLQSPPSLASSLSLANLSRTGVWVSIVHRPLHRQTLPAAIVAITSSWSSLSLTRTGMAGKG